MIPSSAAALGQRSNSYDESFLHRRRGNDSDLIVLKDPPEPRRSLEAPPVVMHNACRTNFGKSQVYQPPLLTSGWRGYQSVQDYNNNKNNQNGDEAGGETSSTAYSTSDSIPFDQEASEIARRMHHTAEESYYYYKPATATATATARNGHTTPNQYHYSRPPQSSLQPLLIQRVGSDRSRPFDEAPTKAQTDWEQSPKRGRLYQGRNYHSDQDLYFGRFQMPPPRVSGPANTILQPAHNNNYYMDSSRRGSDTSGEKSNESMKVVFGNNNKKSNKDDSAFLMENQSGEESSSIPRNYIPYGLQQEKSSPSPSKESRQPSSNSSGDDDDDSLFDFVEDGGIISKVKASHSKRRSSSSSSNNNNNPRRHYYETDDTSLDQPYGSVTAATSLQERTQAAWKRKSSQRGGGGDPGTSSSSSSPLRRHQQVSFGKKNTVQYYNPENDETMESSLLGGRSMNSVYTKSAESEVEDLIKDIFLIGSGKANNPGKRKIKHSPTVKNKLRQRQDLLVNDDLTIETFGEEEEGNTLDDTIEEDSSLPRKTSPHKKSSTTAPTTRKTDRDKNAPSRTTAKPSTVNTASDTTSYTGETTTRNESRGSKSRGVSTKRSSSVTTDEDTMTADESKANDPLASVWGFLFGPAESESRKKKGNRTRTTVDDDDEDCAEVACVKSERGGGGGGGGGGIEDLLNFASDVILGPEGPETRALEAEKKSSKKANREGKTKGMDVIRVDSQVPGVKTAVSLEEDLRLVDLAMQAARSKHRIQGCEMDESYNVNIAEDISFTVLDLEMPLGLIFQENETGCWVTKVLPNGSASRKGNKVQMGDQLAAIDGISAIHMKVGEIADVITSKKGEVELTFLRYVGAFHPLPGSVIEEGWEVRDTPPRQQPVQTPRRSPMTSFFRGSPGKNSSKPAEVPKSAEKRRFRMFRRKKDTKV